MGMFDVFQIPYSALQREHEELITQAAAAGAGTLIRGGAARGTLAADKPGQPGPIGLPQGEGQARWDAADLEGLLDGISRMEFVLRFTLSHPGLSTTIVGTANPDHLRANLAMAGRGPLPGDLYAEALRRLPAPAAGR
jgi:aryl-alcohol dehydrogenase-like predicted oxidoreductase